MADDSDTINDLIDEIYPHLHDLPTMSENTIRHYFRQRVILAARNNDVDAINDALLQRLPGGDSKLYASADSAFNDAGTMNDAIPNEYLNTIAVTEMPLHETTLKLRLRLA
jgi:hypothetical protein